MEKTEKQIAKEKAAVDAMWNARSNKGARTDEIETWTVVNIGCIECDVSSKIVGRFASETEAALVSRILNREMSWREKGQNRFEVFATPAIGAIDDEYIAAISKATGGAS